MAVELNEKIQKTYEDTGVLKTLDILSEIQRQNAEILKILSQPHTILAVGNRMMAKFGRQDDKNT